MALPGIDMLGGMCCSLTARCPRFLSCRKSRKRKPQQLPMARRSSSLRGS